MNKINVLFVEDQIFWQEHISNDLNKEPDIEVVKTCSTKEEALEVISCMEIHVVLLDINLTENYLDGLDTAKEISKMNNRPKIIMLTSLNEDRIILDSFRLGAINFISKSSCKDIIQAVRDAHMNKSAIHADAAAVLRTEIQLSVLTPMEREVYNLGRQGMSKAQISEQLSKSFNTIKSQWKSIKNKLGHH
jgi:two-component system response regulator DevR